MAQTGFFQRDDASSDGVRVTCYVCGGSLRYSDMMTGETVLMPKELHSLWFPLCPLTKPARHGVEVGAPVEYFVESAPV